MDPIKLDQLNRLFPCLTEDGQERVLGLTEGLLYAQRNLGDAQRNLGGPRPAAAAAPAAQAPARRPLAAGREWWGR